MSQRREPTLNSHSIFVKFQLPCVPRLDTHVPFQILPSFVNFHSPLPDSARPSVTNHLNLIVSPFRMPSISPERLPRINRVNCHLNPEGRVELIANKKPFHRGFFIYSKLTDDQVTKHTTPKDWDNYLARWD